MKRLLLILTVLLLWGAASAQQNAILNGLIKTEGDMPEGTRVTLHTVDRDNVWQREIASAAPIAGTFSITTASVPEDELQAFRSGAMLLTGLQNEYTVTPDDARYARGLIGMYVDANGNGVFDGLAVEGTYLGIASLEAPTGFFSLIYVDKDAMISGKGVDLSLKAGWNIFTVRFPESEGDSSAQKQVFEVKPVVDDIVLDVFLP